MAAQLHTWGFHKKVQDHQTSDTSTIKGWSNPPWVKSVVIHRRARSGDGVNENSSCTAGDVRRLCKTGQLKGALNILKRQSIVADTDTYVCLLQECTKIKNLELGKQVHAHIIQSGFNPNNFVLNTLVNMYAKCGSVVDARLVFDNMPERNVFTRTIMMTGYVKYGFGREALEIYQQMIREGVIPNSITFICVLKACASLGALEMGKEVHANIIKAGIAPDTILETALAAMYTKCGNMNDARRVFDNMGQRDVVSWNMMIAGYGQHGCGCEALNVYEQMIQQGVMPDKVTFISVLNACASLGGLENGALEAGRKVHANTIEAKIAPDIILETALVDMYAKCGSLKDAQQVFHKMAQRNVVSWNVLITGFALQGYGREAFKVYEQMLQDGVKPDKVTFICVLNVCASLAALEKGKEFHARIMDSGILPDIILETVLVNMYAKCGSIRDARQIFNSMVDKDVVAWSAMIAGYAQHGYSMDALEMYDEMVQEGLKPNKVTFISVLNACANMAALEKGKEFHATIIKAGFAADIILQNTLINMYAKCGSINDARHLFNNMAEKNLVSWAAMIAGYAQHGYAGKAFEIYQQMVREGFMPDKVTFISVLSACASLALEKGQEVHAHIVNSGIVSDVSLETALVNMYAKCGSMKDALVVFNNMAEKDVVSWSAMIAGYAQHGCGKEAFEMYEQMIQEGVKPNKVTSISALNACASLAVLEKGKEVHSDIIKAGIALDIIVQNTLVDMYSKCGSINDAQQMFADMAKRDVVSWNAVIAGCAQNGGGKKALKLFEQMQQEGLKPNGITFICLLSACSNVGLVDEGCHYFDSMSRDHGLTPSVEHYGCMVNLLGRAGQLNEAEELINKMPIQPGATVWRALLGACRTHGNVEIGERAATTFSSGIHRTQQLIMYCYQISEVKKLENSCSAKQIVWADEQGSFKTGVCCGDHYRNSSPKKTKKKQILHEFLTDGCHNVSQPDDATHKA